MAPTKLTTLAHQGDIPISISEKMEASHITDVDQLYCLIRSMLENGNDRQLGVLASDLNTTVENIGPFGDYIKHYTSPHITDPSKAKEQGLIWGCLITEERMKEMRKVSLMNNEQFEAYQEDLRAKLELRNHAERLLGGIS
jgi:hypothetical protein